MKNRLLVLVLTLIVMLPFGATTSANPFLTCVVSEREDLTPCSLLVPCENTHCFRTRFPWSDCVFNPLDSCDVTSGAVIGERQELPCHYGITPNCRCNEWGDNVIDTTYVNVNSQICAA